MNYEIVYSQQAQKDARKLKKSAIKNKAVELIEIIKDDPFRIFGRLSFSVSRANKFPKF